MTTTIELIERKGKVIGYVFKTVLKSAREMYIYDKKTYRHTEYQTEIESFMYDNDLESFYTRLKPVLKESGDVVCSIEICSIDTKRLEREIKKFREYFNTFLTIK